MKSNWIWVSIILASIFIVAGTTYLLSKKTFYNKGVNEGFKDGWNQGFNSGKVTGEVETKQVLETALKGAAILLVDEKFKTEIPIQSMVTGLDTATRSISTLIKGYQDNTYKVIIDRIIKVGNLSKEDSKEILLNYNKIKPTLSKEVLSDYNKRINALEKAHAEKINIFNKSEAFSASLGSNLCTLIELFSPAQKYKIAEAILTMGNKRNVKEFSKLEITISNQAVNYISNQLCSIVMENSFEFVIKLFLEYSNIVNFTNQYLIQDQHIKQVMKLVTAELVTSSYRTVEIEREWWKVNPNFTIRTNSTVIAGINLEKFYKVEFIKREISPSGKTQIIITLPEPEILSVYPDINPRNENFIFAKELKDHEIHRLYSEENSIARQQAIEKGIIEQAKESASNSFRMLYAPLFLNSLDSYELLIHFDNSIFEQSKPVDLIN